MKAQKIYPDFKTFESLSAKGNLIPVYTEVLADLLTPVSAYMNIAAGSDHSFLLESVEGGERTARYSFLGVNPHSVFKSKDDAYDIDGKPGQGNPFEALRNEFKNIKVAGADGLPPFIGGAVGYMSYDIVRHIEQLPCTTKDDVNLPDMYLMFTDAIMIFDHVKHKIKIVCCARLDGKVSLHTAYNRSVRTIRDLHDRLRTPQFLVEDARTRRTSGKPVKFQSNMTKQHFESMVRKAKKYIKAGDIFQVVLSQRLSTKLNVPPFDVYRALRSLNPSPYMFYLNLGDLNLVGASPEILVTMRDRTINVRPIAGTRPRPEDPKKEQAMIDDLLADEKERAEHVMLVDLGRNDIGRVSTPGTVKVDNLMDIERYSHVIHIVSNVVGKMKRGKDALDALTATFPAGTVSGAPKVRAMEIIDELEPTRRGPYAGSVGYISYSGDIDTCIAIRTIYTHKGKAYIQVGAGIVADSQPAREYQETLSKSKAMTVAIQTAAGGLS
jgi:anthranilate synthase component 1